MFLGTGKTVTGVHIAYWFAKMNKNRKPSVNQDGEECSGSLVFYCGPSNKSVDVVARTYHLYNSKRQSKVLLTCFAFLSNHPLYS